MQGISRESESVDWSQLIALLARLDGVHLQRSTWTLGGSDLVGEMYTDPLLDDLIRALYASGAVFEFDWPTWAAETPLASDPALIVGASLSDLRRLLTAYARQDRFVDGHLGHMVEHGHVAAILRRAAELIARPST